MNEKEQQFLIIVQTMFLANAINRRMDDPEGKERHNYSASAAYMAMDEALYASKRIPDELSASLAANQFASYVFLHEEGAKLEYWFSR